MKKRCLSVLLALALCLSLLPTAAFATEGTQDSGEPAAQVEETTHQVTVSYSLNSDGSATGGTVTGSGNYAAGAQVDITATPGDEYDFYMWTVKAGNVTLDSAGSASTYFIMPDTEVIVNAVFAKHEVLSHYDDDEHWSSCTFCTEGAVERTAHTFASGSNKCSGCEYTFHTVTFHANDGTDATSSQKLAANENRTLAANTFVRSGYTFSGWNTQSDGGGTAYSDEASVNLTGNLSLYAQWTAAEPAPLTISVNPTYLIGGGTITITTSKPANQVTADDMQDLIRITTNDNINWTATIPDYISGRTYFIAKDESGSVESEEVNFSSAFWINPTSETLTGGGIVTLVTAVPVSSVTCDTDGITVQGSGDGWTATLPNSNATYTFTATLDNHTATCTVSVVKRNTDYVTDNSSDDDDDYTPPIPTDTEQNENGDTVTTAEPSTVIKKDTATSTITATDGNRLVNELVRNGSDQLVIAPKIGQDVSGVEVSIPATVVKQLAERTDADLQIATGIAEVNIGSDELDGHSGSLVMEARRTEDGISTKVSIGGVSVIDTGVKLPVGVTLPEDEKLVVGTLQPGGDALNLLPLTETTEPSTRMAMVPEDIIKSMEAAVIGPDGESYTQHERLLINGKEYYVSGSGDGGSLSLYDKEGNIYSYDGEKAPQEIGQDAGTEYPENEFISINGAIYQIHSVQRDANGNGTLILYLDGKPAGMCQFDQYEEMDSINIYNEDYSPDKVKERQQNSNQLGTVTPGENPIDGLESGKTYNVSVIGAQDISVPGYDEAVLNSIKAETEAEKAAKEEVERLKADMEAKEAALDQMSDSDPNYWYAMTALSDTEAAYEAALAELAALANLQSATVTQTFDIPNELVGRTDVTFVAVHNPNPVPVPGSSIRDDIADFIEEWHKQWEETYRPEIGTVEVSEDGQTLTATYTVSSFSPFTIYAFVETEDAEAKVIGSPFADVSTDAWYYDAVKYAYDNGLMAGTSTTERLFSPEGTTTRAQIVTILHRLEGAPAVDYLMQFSDVAEGQWHTEAIRWAASTGITSGTGDGTTFSPNDPITREQLAAFLHRYAQYKGYDVSVGEDTNILSYEDAFTVSEYAYPALQWSCGAGVIGGIEKDGTMYLDPQGSATRAQAAVMLMRFCENVKK